MERNDWQLMEELFHNALDLTGEDRTAYLNQACSGNASLRAEIESLILALEERPDLIEQPAFSAGMRLISEASAEESLIGKVLGPYEILSLLGKGGMGEVYLAHDSRLDRQVALKFLSSGFLDDSWAKRRLVNEAQAIARLDHPNICAVYGFEEYDGYSFIVMQFLEGHTLASLKEGTLIDPSRIFEFAVQIVNALAEAHSHGIVHRDIKPQNIMVTASGQVKVLDFGLAKVIEQKHTATDDESRSSQLGLVVGTVAYMSPEQLRSEKVDFRSDIFSFGIVLYEMISGRNPFLQRSNAEIISAILTFDPDAPPNLASGIPARLSQITQKCLKKNRELRYQSASELLVDLDNARVDGKTRSHSLARFASHARIALAVLLVLIVALALIYSRLTGGPSLAVLPIINESTDASTEFLSKELTDGLIARLSRMSRLQVQAPALVLGYKSRRIDPQEFGRKLGVDAVLAWKITQRADVLTLQARLVNTADGSPIWTQLFERKPIELLAQQEDVVNDIARSVHRSLSGDAEDIFAGQTESNEALNEYRLGRYHWNTRDKEKIRIALDHFQKAVDLDPNYARAYAGLASCYVLMGTVAYGPSVPDAMQKAKLAAETALGIDESLSEAHTALGIVKMRLEWNWKEAETQFERGIRFDPDYAPAHYWYSNLLALMGRSEKAVEESEVARELSPSSRSDINVGRAFYFARDYDRAEEPATRILKDDAENRQALYLLGLVRQQQGRLDESIELLQRLYSMDKLYAAAALSSALARAGRTAEAQTILNETEELSKTNDIPAQEMAIMCIGLGETDRAFELLQKALDDHFTVLPFIKIEPLFDGIRDDPRFADLLRKVNLAP